jgi:hypothetical protein
MNNWQSKRIIELVEAIMARKSAKTFERETIADLGYIKMYAKELADQLQAEIELQAGEDL